MSTSAATHAWTASCPEWKNVPSPMFWNRCPPSCENDWPIHCAPSPPMCVRPVTTVSGRSIIPTSPWQPMPPPASESAGCTVDRLCGQPLQKYAVRSTGSIGSATGGPATRSPPARAGFRRGRACRARPARPASRRARCALATPRRAASPRPRARSRRRARMHAAPPAPPGSSPPATAMRLSSATLRLA